MGGEQRGGEVGGETRGKVRVREYGREHRGRGGEDERRKRKAFRVEGLEGRG